MRTHTTRNISPTAAGVAVHRAIAALLTTSRRPSRHEVMHVVRELTRDIGDFSHTRALRQRIASLASMYFWHLALDETWEFVGPELSLGVGRVDLTFRRDRLVLIDEVKSSVDSALALGRATHEQTDRYVRDARLRYGIDFLGVRVLTLTSPGRSLFKSEPGLGQYLIDTSYHRTWDEN